MLVLNMIFQPFTFFDVALVWDDRTAEIKSFIPIIQYDFGRIAIEQSIKTVFFRKRLYQSCDLRSLAADVLFNFTEKPSDTVTNHPGRLFVKRRRFLIDNQQLRSLIDGHLGA